MNARLLSCEIIKKLYRRFKKIPLCIYGMYATAYNLLILYNFNNYILCYVISQIFCRNCKTFVFVRRICDMKNNICSYANSNIGTWLHFFSSRSAGYNTLTDIPIHSRDIYDTYMPLLNFCNIKNE